MNPLEPRIASLVTANADLRKRVLDLERRINGQVRMLDDLDDVTVTYLDGDPDDPGDGDALTWSLDRQQWVPGPSGGRRVAWTGEIIRESSAWTTKTETAYVDSGGTAAVEIVSGDGVLVKVNAAGIWLVSARIESSAACSKFEVRGTNWSLPDDMSCLPNDAIRYDGATNFTDQSLSGQFWMPVDGTLKVVTDAADCAVYLRVALYMETPLDTGTCE